MKMPNPKLNLSSLKVVPRLIGRYGGFLIGTGLLALVGYTAYQISQIASISSDRAYIESEIDKANQKRIKLDTKTLEQVRAQTELDLRSDLSNLGKGDPFSP